MDDENIAWIHTHSPYNFFAYQPEKEYFLRASLVAKTLKKQKKETDIGKLIWIEPLLAKNIDALLVYICVKRVGNNEIYDLIKNTRLKTIECYEYVPPFLAIDWILFHQMISFEKINDQMKKLHPKEYKKHTQNKKKKFFIKKAMQKKSMTNKHGIVPQD